MVKITESEGLYTKQALLSSMPEPNPTNTGKERIMLQGEVPSQLNSLSGCKFATEKCAQEVPKMVEIAKGHEVACHLF